jgi:phosphatidylglycerol:prolipoprotein diacylglycerol transferase
MRRILFEYGPLTVYSYGFFVALGYFTAIYLGLYLGKKNGFDTHKAMECCFYLVVASLVGGRALYVIKYWRDFSGNWQEIFMFWHGGSIFFGGLIAGMVVAIWYIRKHRIPLWKGFDIAAVVIALGVSIGRIGCFLEGCCYGTITQVPWAVTFPSLAGPRHPTQIYSSLYTFLIFLILWFLWSRRKRDGETFITGMFLYAICRFLEEFVRAGSRYGMLTLSQFIAVGFFIAAAGLFIYRRAHAGQLPEPFL